MARNAQKKLNKQNEIAALREGDFTKMLKYQEQIKVQSKLKKATRVADF
jgi:hypothetical protein